MGLVYLIHFDAPLRHAKHYIGYTSADSPFPRLERHRSGAGAKILAALNRLGIGYRIVRVWRDANRAFERKLKNRKESHCFCPFCRPSLRAFLYRLHHENKGLMTPEEQEFIARLHKTVGTKNSRLKPYEKRMAESLAKRGLIKKSQPARFIYWYQNASA
jgi:hypothetical protein